MKISPVDHIFVGEHGYSVEFLFLYDSLLNLAELELGLQDSLKKFYPLTRRLSAIDEYSYGLNAEAEIELEYLNLSDKNKPKADEQEHLVIHHLPIKSAPGNILFRAQLSHYRDGSALSVNISHCLVDGYSFFMFLSYWANLVKANSRGKKLPLELHEFLPQFDRAILCEAKPASPEDYKERNLGTKCGLFYGKERDFGEFRDSRGEFVRYTKSEIAAERIREAGKSGIRLSDHDIICVRLVRKYAQEWNGNNDDLLISSAFDYRRVFEGLDKAYFGNAIMAVYTEINFKELYSEAVHKIAELIHDSTASVNSERAKASLYFMEQFRREKGIKAVESIHISHPTRGFLITNLSRMPIDSLDFGSGIPTSLIPIFTAPRTMAIMSDGEDYLIRVSK